MIAGQFLASVRTYLVYFTLCLSKPGGKIAKSAILKSLFIITPLKGSRSCPNLLLVGRERGNEVTLKNPLKGILRGI